MNLTPIFIAASVIHGLPPGLLGAVCWVESNHRPEVVHHDDGPEDSVGVCQLHPSTARFMGFKDQVAARLLRQAEEEPDAKRSGQLIQQAYRHELNQLLKPEINIEYAARYLAYQLKRYGDVPRAVTSFNQGYANSGHSKYYRKVQARWNRERNQERRVLARRNGPAA